MKKYIKGFTLVELLVVMVIIITLAAIAIGTFSNFQKRSRDAKRQSDLKVIQSALEQYHADQGYYPAAITPGASLNSATFSRPTPTASPYPTKTYLLEIPADITSGVGYCYQSLPSSPACSNSSADTNCTKYELFAQLETKPEGAETCDSSNYNLKVMSP